MATLTREAPAAATQQEAYVYTTDVRGLEVSYFLGMKWQNRIDLRPLWKAALPVVPSAPIMMPETAEEEEVRPWNRSLNLGQ